MTFKQLETQNLPDIQSQGTLYEHSVLNGSEKYPSKEPFVELIKGSLNTFVNAMTFSDKTIYPVASTNQKDFSHLMGVYLDAVFNPKIYRDSQILEQEGWHYHLENEEDDLIYKGVVYNEMKGATASPEQQLSDYISRTLYPDSLYEHASGGDPKSIPSLTQQEFLSFHEKYYHPSNSLTVLYGDLDINDAFEDLEEYFSGKGKEEKANLSIDINVPTTTFTEETYSITEGDNPKGKDYLSLTWHVAEPENTLERFGLEVLEEILFGNNQSPLKKALLDADIGGDISGGTSEIGYPTAFTIIAKYANADNKDLFKKIVYKTLQKLVNEGIDKELVEASLNKITFHTKEAAISEDNPRGVIYAIQAYSTWLYGESPFDSLQFSDYLEELARSSNKGYFEKLIQTKLIDNPMYTEVVLRAEPGKNDRLEEATLKHLQEYKDTLSKDELNAIIDSTKALITRQETPDRVEDLDKIPTLKKEDLRTNAEEYPLIKDMCLDTVSFYHAPQFTSGIDYVSMYIDIQDATESDYIQLGFLSRLLGKMSTETYTIDELQRNIDLYTGGIHGNIAVFEDDQGNVKPYFVLQGKSLEKSSKELISLMKEILGHTLFEDKKEMLKISQRLVSNFEQTINFSAHTLAASRALSQVKVSSRIKELTQGIEQFNHLKETRNLLKEKNTQSLSAQLATSLKKIFNKNRISFLYVGEEDRNKQIKKEISEVFSDIPSQDIEETVTLKTGKKQNEAFITAQDVNYVAVGADATDELKYSGVDQVLSTALRFNYLWNEIRVKGGAYGSLYSHQRTGSFALASYRDPNIQKTLEVYEKLPEYVNKIELTSEELTKYMIGTISPLEQPKSAYAKGMTAFTRMVTGRTADDIVRLKKEILSTTNEILSSLSNPIEKVLEDKTIVVIGNKTQIEQEKSLFDVIHELY